METIRILDNTARCMQRLGYLKYIAHRCAITETSSLEILGRDLIETVSRKIFVSLDENLIEYIKRRLTDATYRDIKRQLAKELPDTLHVELQDIYLASSALLSRTGKLIPGDWRKYPFFAISLGLIRKGTYSPLVRGQVLIKLCQNGELEAFRKLLPDLNPFVLSLHQKIFFLFCLLENDGDVLKRLYTKLMAEEDRIFTDRDASNLLPEIFREEESRLRHRIISMAERDRIRKLLAVADSIEKWHGKPYTGGAAWAEAVTSRVEPLVDVGLLTKQDPYKFEYMISSSGKTFFQDFTEKTDVGEFLKGGFFKTCAEAFGLKAKPADQGAILETLYQAWQEIKSPLGYAPIEDLALLAGIRSLVDNRIYFEIAEAVQILKEFQRRQPHAVRFNIDRMGNLTYVKFLASLPTLNQGEAGGSGHGTS